MIDKLKQAHREMEHALHRTEKGGAVYYSILSSMVIIQEVIAELRQEPTVLSQIEDRLSYIAGFALKHSPHKVSSDDLDDFTILAKMADELRKMK